MKKIVLTLVVALCATMMVSAQPPQGGKGGKHGPNPEKMVEQRVNELDKAVGLSDTQKQEITQIYKEEMEAMKKNAPQCDGKEVKKGEKPSEEQIKAQREAMDAQRQATDARIEALLSTDQKTKYAEFKSNRQQRHDPRHDKNCCNDNQGGCCDKKGPQGPPPAKQEQSDND